MTDDKTANCFELKSLFLGMDLIGVKVRPCSSPRPNR